MNKKDVTHNEMTASEQFRTLLSEAESIIRQAKHSKKSVMGDNGYADRFHIAQAQAMRIFREMQNQIAITADGALSRTMNDVEKELGYFFDPKTPAADRRELRRHIDMLVVSEIEPAVKAAKSLGSEFIPLEIVNGTRGYLVNVTKQVNGCFQTDYCFDACGVMLRRLLETLIIEVFEKKGLQDRILDPRGNYLMFTDLVAKLINSPETPVGRTTKKELPVIANVLNNCAHNRTFNISKTQLVSFQATLIISIQELIALWDIRKT
jgi:hypothetical protein